MCFLAMFVYEQASVSVFVAFTFLIVSCEASASGNVY